MNRTSIEQDRAIEKLTSKQRAHLRSLAHGLRPAFNVGKEGVTETVLGALREALSTRELLKLKVLEHAPADARETAEALAAQLKGVQVVQVIGRTVVLYRRHPDRPELALPK